LDQRASASCGWSGAMMRAECTGRARTQGVRMTAPQGLKIPICVPLFGEAPIGELYISMTIGILLDSIPIWTGGGALSPNPMTFQKYPNRYRDHLDFGRDCAEIRGSLIGILSPGQNSARCRGAFTHPNGICAHVRLSAQPSHLNMVLVHRVLSSDFLAEGADRRYAQPRC
jgi:hypothetical protein